MTTKSDAQDQMAKQIITTFAPLGKEAIRGLFNLLSSLAQAAAASPVIATGATIIIADALQKFGIITPLGSGIAIAAVTGLGIGQIAEGIIPNLPFGGDKSGPTSVSITYDLPDKPEPVLMTGTPDYVEPEYVKKRKRKANDRRYAKYLYEKTNIDEEIAENK